MWLDEKRGHLVDWTTQRWVQVTGRRLVRGEHGWLDGPAGPPAGIGAGFFDQYASAHGLRLVRTAPVGLVADLRALAGPDFDGEAVAPEVAGFYAGTAAYDVDAWSEWCGPFRPFGAALAALFSRRLQQLNVPLSGLDTSRGMTSDVCAVVDAGGQHVFTAWVRQLVGSQRVVYVGAYSTCVVPTDATRCVRVAFPLPNGNATVIMRPTVRPDGSLLLTSGGTGFGSPGFYFTVHYDDGTMSARYVRAMRETIHVYPEAGEVRADHVLTLFGATFLRLHYRLRRRPK